MNRHYAQRIVGGLEPHEGEMIARGLEEEIERRGLQEAYISFLEAAFLESGVRGWVALRWALIRATPEQKARAFLAVVQEAS